MPRNFLSRGLSRSEAMARTAALTGGKPGDLQPKMNRKVQKRYDARQRDYEMTIVSIRSRPGMSVEGYHRPGSRR